MGTQMMPLVWRIMNAIFSGVAAPAAMMRSPSFSRSVSSTTITSSPWRMAAIKRLIPTAFAAKKTRRRAITWTTMKLDTVKDAIAGLRQGELVIVWTNTDCENEGDLIMAAGAGFARVDGLHDPPHQRHHLRHP